MLPAGCRTSQVSQSSPQKHGTEEGWHEKLSLTGFTPSWLPTAWLLEVWLSPGINTLYKNTGAHMNVSSNTWKSEDQFPKKILWVIPLNPYPDLTVSHYYIYECDLRYNIFAVSDQIDECEGVDVWHFRPTTITSLTSQWDDGIARLSN